MLGKRVVNEKRALLRWSTCKIISDFDTFTDFDADYEPMVLFLEFRFIPQICF